MEAIVDRLDENYHEINFYKCQTIHLSNFYAGRYISMSEEKNNGINQYCKEIRIQARVLLLLSISIGVVGVALFVLCINSSIQENKVPVSIVVFGMICGIVMQLVAGKFKEAFKCAENKLIEESGDNDNLMKKYDIGPKNW